MTPKYFTEGHWFVKLDVTVPSLLGCLTEDPQVEKEGSLLLGYLGSSLALFSQLNGDYVKGPSQNLRQDVPSYPSA